MTQRKTAHLLRKDVFDANQSLLFVSDPITQGENGAHDHDFVELVLVVGGAGLHVSTHGTQTIGRGDFFVLRPGAWHAYHECQDLQVYNCCCAPELLRRELSLVSEDPAITRLLWTEPREPGRRGIVHRTLSEEQTRTIAEHWTMLLRFSGESFVLQAGHLLVLLGQLGRMIYPDEPRRQSGMHTAVRQGVRLLEDECAKDWSLVRLAKATRLAPSYLSRLFKTAIGHAPMSYLARHRAERAANLLLTTELAIGEVGARVGWSDPNYFSRRFKSAFGTTPSAYRKQQAQQSYGLTRNQASFTLL